MRIGRRGVLVALGLCLGAYSVGMGVYAVASTRPQVASQPVDAAEAAVALERLGVAEVYPFENDFVSTPHGRMHYARAGQGDPVLLLHGNPTWSFLYRHVMRDLSDGWQLIAPDLIGFGLSEKLERPGDYSLDGHIDDVSRLVESLDLRNLTLVVQDWGGPIGLGVWLRHPDRVRGLVVMNTYGFSPRIPGDGPARELALRVARAPLMGEQLVQGLGLAQRLLLRSSLAPGADRTLRAYLGVQGSWPERAGALAFPRWVPSDRGDPAAELMARARARLEHGAPRALLLWGMRDPLLGPRVFDEWRAALPDADVVELEHVGHLPPEEAPQDVAVALRRFLRGESVPLVQVAAPPKGSADL